MQGLSEANDHALGVMHALLVTGSILSLMFGTAPIMFGQVKVKWLVTALTSCAMFGITDMIIMATFGPGNKPDIDWGKAGIVLLVIIGICASVVAAMYVADKVAVQRAKRQKRREAEQAALDPVAVAISLIPDMTEDVRIALKRIETFRSLPVPIGRAEDADALVMIDKRLPSVMKLYGVASVASNDEEKQALARTALGSVVEIGRMAEDARLRIAGDLRSSLDTESRYISSRSGWNGGLRAD